MASPKKTKQSFLIIGFVWSLIFAFSPAGLLMVTPARAEVSDPIKYQSQVPFIIIDPNNPESIAEWRAAVQRDFIYYNQKTGKKGSDLLARYLKVIYDYGIFIATIVATLVLMAGGTIWLSSGGNESKIAQAKKMIFSSLTGIIIVFGSWVLLNTINPDLLKMKVISVPDIVTKNLQPNPFEDTASKAARTACEDSSVNPKEEGSSCKLGNTPGYCKKNNTRDPLSDKEFTVCTPCIKKGELCSKNLLNYECADENGICGNEGSGNCDGKKIGGNILTNSMTLFATSPCNIPFTVTGTSNHFMECRCK